MSQPIPPLIPDDEFYGPAYLCSCGHPRCAHYHDHTVGDGGRCHANIYTEVFMGMTVTMCKCTAFQGSTA